MKELFLMMLDGFSKKPLPAICAILIATVAYLALYIADKQVHYDALELKHRTELVETERRCAMDIDNLRKEQLAIIQAALDAQKKINERIERRANRRK